MIPVECLALNMYSLRHRRAQRSITKASLQLGPRVYGVPVVPVVGLIGAAIKVLDTPARRYNREKNTVGKEYDAWTEDGVSFFVFFVFVFSSSSSSLSSSSFVLTLLSLCRS